VTADIASANRSNARVSKMLRLTSGVSYRKQRTILKFVQAF